MPKTRQQRQFVSPDFFQAIRSKFIGYVDSFCGGAIKRLQTEVLPGNMSVHEWAEQFDVEGTWIEDWAQQVIEAWHAGRNIHAEKYILLYPQVKTTAADYFHFRIPPRVIPLSKYALGVIRGGGFREKYESLTDWEAFRLELHAALDGALDEYRANPAKRKRASREVIIPPNLDLYLQEAAVYYFGTMTTKQISEHPGTRRDPTTISRHLKVVLELLDLPTRPKGHRPRKPQTK